MTKQALLPGEQEAWEKSDQIRRWVVRTDVGASWLGARGSFTPHAERASLFRFDEAMSKTGLTLPGCHVAYRARSVRADGTPVVP